MATNPGHPKTDQTEAMARSLHEDDYVVLKGFDGMSDSAMSTVPEKQAFESLEKGSDDNLPSGASFDDRPYYEDNMFLDSQKEATEKKLGKSLENDYEKQDTDQEKNAHVEYLDVAGKTDPLEGQEAKGSAAGYDSLRAMKVDRNDNKPEGEEKMPMPIKVKAVQSSEVKDADNGASSHPGKKDSEGIDIEDSEKTSVSDVGQFNPKEETVDDSTKSSGDTKFGHGDDTKSERGGGTKPGHGGDTKSERGGDTKSERGGDTKSERGGDTKTDHAGDSKFSGDIKSGHAGDTKTSGDIVVSTKESSEDEAPGDIAIGEGSPRARQQADGENVPEDDERRVEDIPGNVRDEDRSDGEERNLVRRRRPQREPEQPIRAGVNQVVHPDAGGWPRWSKISAFLVVVFILTSLVPPPDKRSPEKPVVTIDTRKHLPPELTSSWELKGSCRAYNASYTIKECEWKQIHPLPTRTENTVLQGDGSSCLRGKPYHTIDATLSGFRAPKERGNYVFQLRCVDNTEHANEMRVDIWVNDLVPPVVTVPNNDIVISTSGGVAPLKGSCRASQGTVATERWDFIDGMVDVTTPVEGGDVRFDTPGKYYFKYKCIDSYDAFASQLVSVTVKPSYVLGIDLGTSTTCVVVITEDGTSRDIPIFDGPDDLDPCMPSVVAFARDGRVLVGEKAVRQAVENPASTIYEVKRLMGRSYYDDPNHTFSYRVRPTLKSHSPKGVRAAIEIPCNGTNRLIQPELVSALILRHVADAAQNFLKVYVKDVVISVPAQFDDAQRKATKDAGLIAGLNPIKIVNEPTVAAFASRNLIQSLVDSQNGGNEKTRETVTAVVADIGGGTTDYALMQIQGTNYKVLTTDGDKTLGGRDIDIRLAEKLTAVFANKHPGLDLGNKQFQQQLRIACETAKVVLSEKQQYVITVDYTDESQVEPLPLQHMLTRDEFEGYISDILEAMIKPLEPLISRSGGLNKGSVEELYLVGGTSNIPKLKEMLKEYFNKVNNVYHKDPVQLVGRGAAAFGAVLTHLLEIQSMPRVDVTPLPISIAVDMGKMHEVFARNRIYPCIEYLKLSTFADSQTAIMIKVYEGDGLTEDECHFLGEFELSGIPALPKGVPEINATFRIDSNGILIVRADHGKKGTALKLDVYSKSGSMTVKSRDDLTALLTRLMQPKSSEESKCSALEVASPMGVIPPKPPAENVLKLSVDSEYDSVQILDTTNPAANLSAMTMVAVKGFVTDEKTKESDLDIVLVIDESGSMVGLPIDTIKRVIELLIGVLKPNHRLGIVTYESYVHRRMELTYCTDDAKQTARGIVKQIYASGQTNLYEGLLTGLQMAYHGSRRSRVLLFTDGQANVGIHEPNEIIREIVKQTTSLSSLTSAQVTLSTFGYLGEHDEFLLSSLASNVGGGSYNFLDKNSALAVGFGYVLGDAINTVAETIQLTVTPQRGVQIVKAITHFTYTSRDDSMTFEIPSTANQQARHVLLQLTVPPCNATIAHDNLLRVELTYKNTITEREEGGDEYLFVARTRRLDVETRSREVDEQMNRVRVADAIGKALDELKEGKKQQAINLLQEAKVFVSNSISKEHTLSLCLRNDLEGLINNVKGDINDAKKFLQDSLTSHWQEKGGKGSCYLTKKEDKLITILKT